MKLEACLRHPPTYKVPKKGSSPPDPKSNDFSMGEVMRAVAATTLAPLSQAGRLRCLCHHLVKHCADLWERARHKMDEARQVSHFPLRGWCLGLPDQRNPVGGWEHVRWREEPLQKPRGKIQWGLEELQAASGPEKSEEPSSGSTLDH